MCLSTTQQQLYALSRALRCVAEAAGRLKLLEGERLRQPVELDVIRSKYEDALGTSSPRSMADVDLALLKAAVVDSYNERYGEAVRDFQSLMR